MKNQPSENITRKAQFAGQFYPAEKKELQLYLEQYFSERKSAQINAYNMRSPRAIIVPHAGYVFSGKVAAAAYINIPRNTIYKNVFIIASSHRYSFEGAAVYNSGDYETPLGKIEVAKEIADKLLNKSDLFLKYDESHINEHSLEVQLPFLQYILKDNLSIVPIILGTHDPKICHQIAKVLDMWFNEKNLFVISTDFSHYPDYENAVRVDEITSNSICRNKPSDLIQVLKENKNLGIHNLATSLCGWTSVLTLLYMTANKDVVFEKNLYSNSGDIRKYGDTKRVVGYWAITVFDKEDKLTISEKEQVEILGKAHKSIETFVKTGKRNTLTPPLTNGILSKKLGAFVSIYIDGKLRGCIGGFAQEKTLNELIQKTAVSASADHRFKAVQIDELNEMELEISILSPLKQIKSTDEIVLGKHGIYIRSGTNSGTFLPQVALKTGWNLEEFLGHCSRDKAGIGWDGWKTAELFTYEAFIFRG